MTTRRILFVAAFATWAISFAGSSSAETKICLVLPKAQLGQGTSGADVAEPVRATLTAYLGGPATQLVPLTARIPIQIDAEAQQLGCEYVLYTSVTQKKSGGLSKMFAAAAPLATMAGGMGAMGGNYGTMMAGQVVAQAATTAASQSAQQEAMEALGGAAKSNIKKGDQITLDYKLVRPGVAEAIVANASVAKAKESGEDLVSPLIEQAATSVLTAISRVAGAARK
jgi:hypothetical protein